VKSFDASKARAMPGVTHVVQISSGVAVVAGSFWQAKTARDALAITWDEGANAENSSAKIARAMTALAAQPGVNARKDGDPQAVLGAAPRARTVEATYELPFLAHATMEPMNATAHVRADGVDIWVGTQFQSTTQNTGARIAGVPPEKVQVHTTYLGGGFGRRAGQDFVADALETSKAVGAPVKVMWTREDDMHHGLYRPISLHTLRGALDASGKPSAWTHRLVAPSIRAGGKPQAADFIDREAVEGATGMPYDIGAVSVDYSNVDTGVPVTFWRSVNNSFNAFAVESFIDELAHAAKQDPFEFRRALLGKAPRHLRVLELAAKESGWGTAPPAGRARGIAVAKAFGSYVAEVAEVSVGADGTIRVHRVTCAFDCGPVVNPLTVEAQAQSGIVYGLTAALYGEITIDRGRVVQNNFNDYRMLRMREMPAIDVHLVQTDEAQGGAGEPGTPPIAPAVANAVFALTGKRLRTLPFKLA
ncbi:MAG TPA: molybdopterin cofactor-binding domain-containing protein, partial [Gemmatimonadaceae bacterium]|nr:molybdopterin cofactor-binding domain-containing protein [Gemmatimonadaceae bacterium]